MDEEGGNKSQRIEQDLQQESLQNDGVTSAHTVDHDSWQQAGLLMITSYNCGWILTFPNIVMVPLGWKWGVVCLIVVGLYTAYANWLLASFHFINGRRFIRYRDIMGFLFGNIFYHLTWACQFVTLILGNMVLIVLGSQALKAINSEFSDSPLRLQYYIVITGITYFLFAFFIPTLSAMKNWLAVSGVLTCTYVVVTLSVAVKDGKSNSERDYDISGSKMSMVFRAFGSISAIIVTNTSGLLPEIQSTLRKPVVRNMKKALLSLYTVGVLFYYGIIVVGYWAYGSNVSVYLPNNFSGPKWTVVLVNAVIVLQNVVSQHMFVAPIHEALDTRFLDIDKGMHENGNLKRLFLLRAIFFSFNTLVSAAFPFMGDFVNLFGSCSLILLTFVFPSMIFLKVKGKTARTEKKAWHWFSIVFSSALAVVTTISAVRSIVGNIRTYHFFANV